MAWSDELREVEDAEFREGMFDLRLDGPSESKAGQGPAARRRRRDRESILITRGDADDDAPPPNLLEAAGPEPPKPAKENGGSDSNFYTAVKWQPSKAAAGQASAAAPKPRGSPLASSTRLNASREPPIFTRLAASKAKAQKPAEVERKPVVPVPTRTAVPKRAQAPSATLRTAPLATTSHRPVPKENVAAEEPKIESARAVEAQQLPAPEPEPLPTPVTPPSMPSALELPPQIAAQRDPDDVYGFASFQEAFVTEGEMVGWLLWTASNRTDAHNRNAGCCKGETGRRRSQFFG